MSDPIVSILSPTYNHEKYIHQCILSAQNQTFQNWEMLILDDGSLDNTYVIAKSYADKDPRIKVLTQANKGIFKLGETYNRGLSQARGKYIAILEGDDMWSPTKLERQVIQLENDPSIVIAWGQNALMNEDLSTTYSIQPNTDKIASSLLNNTPPGSIIEILPQNAWLPALTLLIRKENLLRIGGFIQSHGMPLVDFPTLLTISTHGPFYYDNFVMGVWRIYSTQTTKKYTTEMWLGMKQFISEWLPKIHSIDSAKRRDILKCFDQICLTAYARSGRYKLIRREFESARKDYLKALFYPIGGKLVWRLRALIGYTFSFLKLDVEWLAKLLGKKTYSNK